ncbi:MAG: SUMF1/EgtB/PvdO family nonheme iron enzyme [Noviherbaspirillum sp.]
MASLICISAAHAAPAQDEPAARRVALVIGNAAYAAQPLASAANDARAMALALQERGYAVTSHENLTQQGMLQALLAFRQQLEPGGVGLFYFAGHGIQTGSRVRLLPVDVAHDRPATLLTRGTELDRVLDAMAAPRAGKANLVLLDTCLDNPFNAAVGRPTPPPAATLVAYATRPGGLAQDSAGRGVWTAEVLRTMAANGGELPHLLAGAALRVGAHADQQQPWLDTALTAGPPDSGPAGSGLPAAPMHSRGVLPKDSAEQYELTFWESIKDSSHPSDYEAYLQAYPNGRFAGLARARMERLRAAAPKAEPPAARPAPEKPRAAPARRPADAPPAPTATPTPTPEPERPAAAPSLLQKAGADIRDCPACPVLAAIPQGVFTMGSNSGDPSEKPARRVTVEAPFAIGRTEVTVEQWNACVEAGACQRTSDAARAPNTPARDVSWDDAQLYVKWLTKVSGKPYRLPTEAEWEFAARGGTSSRYWWGEDMRRGNANCKDCGEPWQADGPTPVASFPANGFGLHDMNGSVWEWVEDCWHSSFKNAPADARAWNESFCTVRVIRGGSWRDGASYMPATTRFKYDGSVRHSQNGFRVARDIK